jgi:hypothetical protein
MAFATGKYAYGLCDFCGQRYAYSVLRKQWQGFMVCPDDYEPKEPQLDPLRYKADAIALRDPRPNRIEPVSVYVGAPGFSAFQSYGSVDGTANMRPYVVGQPLVAKALVGSVTVVTS